MADVWTESEEHNVRNHIKRNKNLIPPNQELEPVAQRLNLTLDDVKRKYYLVLFDIIKGPAETAKSAEQAKLNPVKEVTSLEGKKPGGFEKAPAKTAKSAEHAKLNPVKKVTSLEGKKTGGFEKVPAESAKSAEHSKLNPVKEVTSLEGKKPDGFEKVDVVKRVTFAEGTKPCAPKTRPREEDFVTNEPNKPKRPKLVIKCGGKVFPPPAQSPLFPGKQQASDGGKNKAAAGPSTPKSLILVNKEMIEDGVRAISTVSRNISQQQLLLEEDRKIVEVVQTQLQSILAANEEHGCESTQRGLTCI